MELKENHFGEIFFVISVFIIFYLSKGDKILYSIPILILTFADSTAALIGKNYGKNNIAKLNEDAKSIEGSFMFFMVAFMITLVPLLLFTEVGREETLIISTIIGFNIALIEMVSHTGNDNILIPLTTYALLITHINLEITALRINLVILALIFVIVTIANRVKAWSKIALVEALVIGYLTATMYGLYALIPPVILFLTCMRLPKVREEEKNKLYDARIIETNAVIGIAICGIAKITGFKAELFMLYALVYSMHLAINTFIRLKYYFNLSELDSVLLSAIKGLIFIFLPSILVQKIVFGNVPNLLILCLLSCIIFLSSLMISAEKKDVEKEEITIKNGYMHMKIVFVLTIFAYFLNSIQI